MGKEISYTLNDIDLYLNIRQTVTEYVLGFESDDERIKQNFDLKKNHIQRVIDNVTTLAQSLNWETEKVRVAQLIALLHDIGRFEQFKQYQTFADSVSEDHAELGIKIIVENGWLNNLEENLQKLILRAVSNHNKLVIPKTDSEEIVLFSKIIRDADKIDIYDICIKEYQSRSTKKNNSLTLDLKNSPAISSEVAKSILSSKLPDKKHLITVTDFKLMQMAYVFDVNFKTTFEIISQRQYLQKIFDTLSKSDQVFELYRKTKIHVENQLLKK
jgi:HD superfamily phosphohydrolase YqeK